MKNASIPEMKLGLRIHATAFALTMALLLIINLWTGAPYWFLWVVPGWGIGLLAHWWAVGRHVAGKAGTA